MAYIGKTPVIGNFQKCDSISVVNGQAAYTLQVGGANVSPQSENHMLVSLNGILQAPVDSFTVSGSTLTFASNLVTGDVIDFVMILGNVLDLGVPSDNTVSLAKLTATGTKDATTFLRGDNTFAEAGGGKVLQVVQNTTTSNISTNSTSYVASGFTQSITPSSTSNKILIQLSGGALDYDVSALKVFCALYYDINGGGYSATGSFTVTKISSTFGVPNSQTFLLSPNTTSVVTVQPYLKSSTTNNAYINRDSAMLTLTLTEIAG